MATSKERQAKSAHKQLPKGPSIGASIKGRNVRRFQFLLDPSMCDLVVNHLKTTGMAPTSLMKAALSRYLHQEDNYWNLVFKNLEHTSMEMRAVHAEMRRFANGFLHFVFYWFMTWPDTAPDQRKDMIEKAYLMIDKFSKTLDKRLSHGGYLTDFNMEDIKSLILENADELDPAEVHQLMEEERRAPQGKSNKKGESRPQQQPDAELED